jgi:adenosylmethionine-8-amino-7-oxononanoate aminotransferase
MEDLAFDRKHIIHPYDCVRKPQPVQMVVAASGVDLFTADGRRLIDGISSWWCVIHGYNRPEINGAIEKQLSSMAHVMFGGLTHLPAVELSRKLLELVPFPMEKIFYCESGSVAVEVALKMALQWTRGSGLGDRRKFFALRGAYHGDTLWPMSLADPHSGMHRHFTSLLPEQIFLPRPPIAFADPADRASIRVLYEPYFRRHGGEVAALILEPIAQCAGGMWFYAADYLTVLGELCRDYGILFIFDEIATGFGRTGRLFAGEWSGAIPDILCIGKALSGGYLPLSAVLVAERVLDGMAADGPIMHGPTFMANPLACAAACASLELLKTGEWAAATARLEKAMEARLRPLERIPSVRAVRVLGSMGAVEMDRPVDRDAFRLHCINCGVWLRPLGELIYLMPAYCIGDGQLEKILDCIVGWVSGLATST